MGIYTVFLDLAMATGSPVLGWVAARQDIGVVFIVSAGVALGTVAVALRLLLGRRQHKPVAFASVSGIDELDS